MAPKLFSNMKNITINKIPDVVITAIKKRGHRPSTYARAALANKLVTDGHFTAAASLSPKPKNK